MCDSPRSNITQNAPWTLPCPETDCSCRQWQQWSQCGWWVRMYAFLGRSWLWNNLLSVEGMPRDWAFSTEQNPQDYRGLKAELWQRKHNKRSWTRLVASADFCVARQLREASFHRPVRLWSPFLTFLVYAENEHENAMCFIDVVEHVCQITQILGVLSQHVS